MARAGLTAERITEAAAEMADTTGFTGVTISALARHFGVKDASLYSHVRNLAELRARVAVLAAGELSDRIGSAIAGRAGRDALVAFADAYRAYALEHPGRYAATQLQLDPEIIAGSSGHRRCMELPYSLLRGYGLSEPDITDAVRLLRSTFHGYAHLEAGGGFGHPREVRASWERAVHALHIALENWPGLDDA
ncbi:TetR/AcrR family transcriptional regulator [Saccharopolyspora indica]|uniref:TetR/AcrR family transcriptional regulator n=1 Tax=Saccharopolyspora indica TaxID=1229659 RepID=UPI0022EB8A21|nr:TetR/AcrR family transcriptional regulator [Saccharopolyspora indica]MDA3645660.1 TetR/AcrR family transcriptional regulator [Saccharopolyspora indica]